MLEMERLVSERYRLACRLMILRELRVSSHWEKDTLHSQPKGFVYKSLAELGDLEDVVHVEINLNVGIVGFGREDGFQGVER